MPDLQPDPSEVMQEEGETLSSVPVVVEEVKAPVRVQVLPRKGGSTRTRTVSAVPVQLLTADHWRANTILMGDVAFRVAFSQAAAQDSSTMALWPGLVPLSVDATVEVWAVAAGDDVQLSIITTRWAEG